MYSIHIVGVGLFDEENYVGVIVTLTGYVSDPAKIDFNTDQLTADISYSGPSRASFARALQDSKHAAKKAGYHVTYVESSKLMNLKRFLA